MLDKIYHAEIKNGAVKITEWTKIGEKHWNGDDIFVSGRKRRAVSQETTTPGWGETPQKAVASLRTSRADIVKKSSERLRKAQKEWGILERWINIAGNAMALKGE